MFRGPAALAAVALLITGCAGERPVATPAPSAAEAHAWIERALPRNVADRSGWAADLFAGFTALGVAPTRENVCAVAAVIEQESGFQVDPVVPGLPAIAWREIDERAAHAGVPRVIVHGVLGLASPTGRSYGERIDGARTEKALSDIFEDFIAAVPLGRTLFAEHNPIRTRGPMQVHVLFAERFAAARPYPYPVKSSIADEVFTRRGGLYFGIAHLLDYAAPYDRYRYRFADFNAGQYASRNAAFQEAVARVSGAPLVADGILLPPDGAGNGATERAAIAAAARLDIGQSEVHDALQRFQTRDFENTSLYRKVFAAAERPLDHMLPRGVVPHIELHGPKISRKLTTAWYADRVDERFERCLRRSGR